MKYLGQTEYSHDGPKPTLGVLISNLGTPDAPTTGALRRYLKEFLSDPRVVEVPRPIWWLILNLIILRIRPSRSAKLYQQVWTEQGSPLLATSLAQKAGLQALLDAQYGAGKVPVVLGMRYGNPSIQSAIEELTALNVREIVVLPLYPQYCAATTGSTFDALAALFTKTRWVPTLHLLHGYHSQHSYIQALADSVQKHVEAHGMPDRLLFSYHGTPERYLMQGDPYHCFCHQTTRLVRERLHLPEERVQTTFQSRFGKEPWLQPYTDQTLMALAAKGVKHVAVICPGFSADCLETLEEINEQARHQFLEAGGAQFHYISALNDDPTHLRALADVLEPYLRKAKRDE